MSFVANRPIHQIETECKLKGIDIETAYAVCIARVNNSGSIRERIIEDILPKVTLYNFTMFSTFFVCDREMMTYLKLTYGDYIRSTGTYIEWRKQFD